MKGIKISKEAQNAIFIGTFCSIAYLAVFFAKNRNALCAAAPLLQKVTLCSSAWLQAPSRRFAMQCSSTRFAKTRLKTIINRFFNALFPLRLRVPLFIKINKKQTHCLLFIYGAGGGTRTHTPSLTTDFESVSSASSNTPACFLELPAGIEPATCSLRVNRSTD